MKTTYSTQRELQIAILEANKDTSVLWRLLGQFLVLVSALVISLLLNS